MVNCVYRVMHYSVVACRLSIRPSVRPSVRLSVTLVDEDHIGWLEILETNCNYSNTFALRSPKVIQLLPWEHGEILERRGGEEKVACWSTKVAISLKRVKIEQYGEPIGSHQCSFEWYHLRPPTASSYQNFNRSQEWVKLWTLNLADTFTWFV